MVYCNNPNGRPKGSKNKKPSRLRFKQAELMRGIRACAAMQMPIHSIVINPELGTIVINPAVPATPTVSSDGSLVINPPTASGAADEKPTA
jgi:hypothetical protein